MNSDVIIDVGTMCESLPLTRERVAALAHEAARLGYHAARIDVGGITVVIHARFSPADFCRRHGLTPAFPPQFIRHGLVGSRSSDTSRPDSLSR